eukprot:2137422-Pyramimonas_sp.AAC.1
MQAQPGEEAPALHLRHPVDSAAAVPGGAMGGGARVLQEGHRGADAGAGGRRRRHRRHAHGGGRLRGALASV